MQINRPCPICQPEQRRDQNALSIMTKGGKTLLHCHKSGCDFRDIARALDLVQPVENNTPSAQRGPDEIDRRNLEKAQEIWRNSRPCAESLAARYLQSRGIRIAPPNSLRFAPLLYHSPSVQYLPALVARIDPMGAVHRTYLTDKATKIAGSSAKMALGRYRGGAVQLSAGRGPVIACEGIENGLSILQLWDGAPPAVLAALSASNLPNLVLPEKGGDLIVAFDIDQSQTGYRAALDLAERAGRVGWSVSLLAPPNGAGDWNEYLIKEVMS